MEFVEFSRIRCCFCEVFKFGAGICLFEAGYATCPKDRDVEFDRGRPIQDSYSEVVPKLDWGEKTEASEQNSG